MKVSAVVVSYRSAARACAALASLRREAGDAGLSLEAIAVVNSDDPAEAAALRGTADDVVVPGRNLGYAGGLNAGLRRAHGDVLLLANPDLLFRPGSLAALVGALEPSGAVAAGPAFFWDSSETLLLPPAEEPRPAGLLRRRLAEERPGAGRRLFAREARRLLAYAAGVARGETVEAAALSGALMATTREALDRAGPFDEGFRLYYEENDWQRRLRERGGRLLSVGAARVIHAFNRSANQEPRAASWFSESERRYFVKHFGEAGRRLAERPSTAGRFPEPPIGEALTLPETGGAAIAVSPLRSFVPFALARPAVGTRTWNLPDDVRGSVGDGAPCLYGRVFREADGATLDDRRLVVSSGASAP